MYAIMMLSHHVINFTFNRNNIVTVKMSHVLHGNSYFRVQVFFESEIVNQYPTFRNHITELYDNRKADWCSAFRHDTFQSVGYHFSDKLSLFYEVAIGSPAPSGWLDLLHGGLNQAMSASVEVPAPVDVPVPLEVPTPVGVPDPAEILDPAEEIAQHIATVDRLFKTKVHDVARENPDAFISAYKTFIDTLQSLSTANAAASALHTFGKYAGGGKRVGKRLSSITVQSTAIARRKKLLRG